MVVGMKRFLFVLVFIFFGVVGFVGNVSGQYCDVTDVNSCENYISRVQLAEIDNTSGCSANAYQNFTSQSATVEPGKTYLLIITAVTGNSYGYLSAFCDFNKNNVFNGGAELIVDDEQADDAPYLFKITVPAAAPEGQTRLRIRLTYVTNEGACDTDPFEYTETEDYTINVCTAAQGVGIAGLDPNNCEGTDETLSVSGLGGKTIVRWETATDTLGAWTDLGNSPTISTGQITEARYYRVLIDNGVCQAYTIAYRKSFVEYTLNSPPVVCERDTFRFSASITPERATISSNSELPIPDDDGVFVESSLNISNVFPDTVTAGTINKVCLTMGQYGYGTGNGYEEEIEIDLISPDGRVMRLKQNTGALGATLVNDLCFTTDPGDPNIETINEATTGDFRPIANAGTRNMNTYFTGEPANGTWRLRLSDQVAADEGSLFRWSMEFNSGIYIVPDPTIEISYTSNTSGEVVFRDPQQKTITVRGHVPGESCGLSDDIFVDVLPTDSAFAGPDIPALCSQSKTGQLDANPVRTYNSAPGADTISVGTWRQLTGTPGVIIADDNDPKTGVTYPSVGTFTFEWFTETFINGVSTGCTSADTVSITLIDQSITVSTVPDTLCLGESAQLSAVFSPTNGTFTNNTGAAIPANNAAGINSDILVNNVHPNSLVDYAIESVCVVINHSRSREVNISLTAPSGAPVVLKASGSGNNGGNEPATVCFVPDLAPHPAAQNLTNGNYGIQAGNLSNAFSGRTANGTWRLNVNDQTGGLGGGSGTFNGWNITFKSNLQWTPAASLNNPDTVSPVATPTATTDYVARLFVPGANCSDFTDTIRVYVVDPVTDAGANDSICGFDYDLKALNPKLPSSPNAVGTWSAVPGNPSFTTFSDVNDHNANIIVSAQGAYLYEWVVTQGDCERRDTVQVFFKRQVLAPLTSDVVICNRDSIDLQADNFGADTTYKWYSAASGGALLFTGSPYRVGPTSTTTYHVSATYFGCPETARSPIEVTVTPLPVIAIDAIDEVCLNYGDTTLNVTVDGNPNPAGGIWTSSAPTAIVSNQFFNTQNATAGTHKVYYEYTDGGTTCTNSDSIEILVKPLPIPTASASSPICVGDTLKLQASGGDSYEWFHIGGASNGNTSNGFTSSNQNPFKLNAQEPADEGRYVVVVTDASTGCFDSLQTNNVNVNGLPTVNSTGDTEYCAFDTIRLTATGAVSYNWYGPNGFTATNTPSIQINTVQEVHEGSYFAIGINGPGCRDTLEIPVLIHPKPVIQLDSIRNLLCFEDSTGYIYLDTVPGTTSGGSVFTWNDGITTKDRPQLQIGTYEVIVEDIEGCSDTASYTIQQPKAITVGAFQDSVSCFGFADGSIGVWIDSDSAGYEYSITKDFFAYTTVQNTNDTNIFNGLSAGIYEYSATDKNGCSDTLQIEVLQPDTFIIGAVDLSFYPNDPAYNNVSCNGATDDSTTFTMNGGTPPFTYVNTTTGTTQVTDSIFRGLGAGTYDYQITDANGCSTDTLGIIITEPTLLTATAEQDSVNCFSEFNGSLTIHAVGGTLGYDFEITSGPNGYSAAKQKDSTFSGLEAGVYNYQVTDTNGCTFASNIEVLQPDTFFVASYILSDYNGFNITCKDSADGTIELNATGGTKAYEYQMDGLGFGSNNVFSIIDGGDHTFDVRDYNGCLTDTTIFFNEPRELQITAEQDSVTCFGLSDGKITVTVVVGDVPGFRYSLNMPPIIDKPDTFHTFTGLPAGNYVYLVSDDNGCEDFATIDVLEPDTFAIDSVYFSYYPDTNTITYPNISCNGGSDGIVRFGMIGGVREFTYTDNTNGISKTTDSTFTGYSAGDYSFTITDFHGNCPIDTTLSFTEPTAVDATANQDSLTCFKSTDGSFTVSATGGTPGYSYRVTSGPNGYNTLNKKDPTFSGLEAGTYNYLVTDTNGCTFAGAIEVLQPDSFQVIGYDISDYNGFNITCKDSADGTITLHATGGTQNYQYQLDGTGYVTNNSFTIIDGGDHLFELVDRNGCTTDTTIFFNEPRELEITAVQDSVSCFGYDDGSITVTVLVGDVPGFKYSLNMPPIIDKPDTFHTFTGLTAGMYTYLVSDDNGCEDFATIDVLEPDTFAIDSIYISNYPNDDVTSFPNISCNGGSDGIIRFALSGGTRDYSYTDDAIGTPNPSPNDSVFANYPAGTYNFTITDYNNCEIKTSVELIEPTRLTATATQDSLTCYQSGDGSITITPAGGVPTYDFEIKDSTTNTTIAQADNNVFTGLAADKYYYTVTDTNGCTYTDSIVVKQPDTLFFQTVDVTTYHGGFEISCADSLDGEIKLGGIGGTRDYTYTTNAPTATYKNDSTFVIIDAGTYTFSIEDRNGCTADTSYTFESPSQLEASAVQDSVTCFDGADGSITITVDVGDVGGYDYSLVNQATGFVYPGISHKADTAFFSGLTAGIYSYGIKDSNDCTVKTGTQSIEVLQPDTFRIDSINQKDYNGFNVACFSDKNDSTMVHVSGGTRSYGYSVDNVTFQSDSLYQDTLGAGTYTVYVQDKYGCTVQRNFTITEAEDLTLDTIVSDYNGFDITCADSATGWVQLIADKGAGAYEFKIDTTGASWVATSRFNNLTAGTYQFFVKDANNCLDSITVTLDEPVELIVDASYNLTIDIEDSTVCEGSQTLFYGNANRPIQTWDWQGQNGFNASSNNTGIASPVPAHTGEIILTATTPEGCISRDTLTLTVNPTTQAGSLNPPGVTTLCKFDSLELSVVGNTGDIVRYEWVVFPPSTPYDSIEVAPITPQWVTFDTTRLVRAVIQSGVCPDAATSPIQVRIDEPSTGGTAIATEDTICINTRTTINLSGHRGNIQWERYESGAWTELVNSANSIGVTTPSLNVLVSQDSTLFRAKVTNGVCDEAYSNEVVIRVDLKTQPGTVKIPRIVCDGFRETIELQPALRGDILQWEYSEDEVTWIVFGTATVVNTTPPITADSTFFRAIVKNGTCPRDTSYGSTGRELRSEAGIILADDTVLCQGSGTNLTLDQARYTTNFWQIYNTSTSTFVPTGTFDTDNFSTGSLNIPGDYLYRVVVKNGVCPHDTTLVTTIQVDPTTVAGVIAEDNGRTRFCFGETANLRVNGETGEVIAWTFASNPVTPFDGDTLTHIPLETGTYIATIQSGVCPQKTASLSVLVDSLSVGGIIDGDTSAVCLNEETRLVLNNFRGESRQWQFRNASTANIWTNTFDNNTIQFTGPRTEETEYRVVVKNGTCPRDTSLEDIISIIPSTLPGTISVDQDTICENNNVTFEITGHRGRIIWERSFTGVTGSYIPVDINNSPIYSESPTQTIFVRARVQNSVCADSLTNTIRVFVYPKSNTGDMVPDELTICKNGSIEFSLPDANGVLKWFTRTIPGGPLVLETGQTTNVFQKSGIDREIEVVAVNKNGVCPADTAKARVYVDLPTQLGSIAATPDSICIFGQSTLEYSGGLGEVIDWEISQDNGPFSSLDKDGPTLNTGSLDRDAIFRAIVKNGVCPSRNTTQKITVSDSSQVGEILGDPALAACEGSEVELTATGIKGKVTKWQQYDDVSAIWNDVAGPNTNPYRTGPVPEETKYRVVVKSGVCPSKNSEATITIDEKPIPGTATAADSPICAGESTTVEVTGYTGNLAYWERSIDNGVTFAKLPGLTDDEINTGQLAFTSIYRAAFTSGVCPVEYAADTIIVDSNSNAGSLKPSKELVCQGTPITITANGVVGDVVGWSYSIDNGDSFTPFGSLAKTQSFTVNERTIFKLVVLNGVCEPDSSFTTVRVDVPSIAGEISFMPDSICEGTTTEVSLSGYRGDLKNWENDVTGVFEILPTFQPTFTSLPHDSSLTYRAIVKNGVCPADTVEKLLYVLPRPIGGNVTNDTVLCIGNSTTLNVTGADGDIVWEYSIGGVNFHKYILEENGTSLALTPEKTLFYRVRVSRHICPDAFSNAVRVQVDTTTVVGEILSDTNQVCEGTRPWVRLSERVGDVTTWRFDDGNATQDYGTGQDSVRTKPTVEPTTTMWVVVKSGVCPADSTSYEFTVDEMTEPGTLTADPDVICIGETSELSIDDETGEVVRWERSDEPRFFDSIPDETGTSYTTEELFEKRFYRVWVKNQTCPEKVTNIASVDINQKPVLGPFRANPDTICSGSDVYLSVDSYTGTLEWQKKPLSGTFSFASDKDDFVDKNVTETTVYQITISRGVCEDTVATDTVYVTEPSEVGTLTASRVNICRGEDVTLSVTGMVGEIVQWAISTDGGNIFTALDEFGTSFTHSPIKTAIYRVSVKNGLCPKVSKTIQVKVDQPASVQQIFTTTDTICTGEEAQLTAQGVVGTISTWLKDGVSIGLVAPAISTGVLTETTTFTVVVDNGACEADSTSRTIVVQQLPKLTIVAAEDTLCGPGTVELSYLVPNGTFGNWFSSVDGDTPTRLTQNGSPIFVPVTKNTVFSATASNKGCGVVTEELSISVFPKLSVIVPEIACIDTAIEVFATGGYGDLTFTYTDPTSATNTVTRPRSFNNYYYLPATISGTYVIDVMQTGVCSKSFNESVAAVLKADYEVDITNVTCFGLENGELNINLLNGELTDYYVRWFRENETDFFNNQKRVTGVEEGNYYVEVSPNLAEECVVRQEFTVTQPDELTLSSKSVISPQCNDGNNGVVQANVVGGAAPYTVVWSYDNPNNETSASPSQTGGNLTVEDLYSGKVDLMVTDTNNCVMSRTFTLDNPERIELNATIQQTRCYGDSTGGITTAVTGGKGPYSYVWQDDVSKTGPNRSNVPAGTYTVAVTDEFGCVVNRQAIVTQPLDSIVIVANALRDTVCGNTFDGWVEISANGGTPALSAVWSDGTKGFSNPNLGTGTYFVTVTDGRGCHSTYVDSIASRGEPDATFTFTDPECEENRTVIDFGQVGMGSISVVGPGATSLSPIANSDTAISLTVGTMGNYIVTRTVTDGTCADTYVDTVPFKVLPTPSFQTELIGYGSNVRFENTSENAVAFRWTFDDFDNSSLTNPEYLFETTTPNNHVVSLTAISEQGCEVEIRQPIEIGSVDTVFIPNAFTPNGDDVNDTFKPVFVGYDIKDYNFSVFSRWGEELFQTNDSNIGWDGYSEKNKELSNGIYTWFVTFTDGETGEQVKQYGTVELIR